MVVNLKNITYLKALEIAEILPGLKILKIGQFLKILEICLQCLQTLWAHIVARQTTQLGQSILLQGRLQLAVLQCLLLLVRELLLQSLGRKRIDARTESPSMHET